VHVMFLLDGRRQPNYHLHNAHCISQLRSYAPFRERSNDIGILLTIYVLRSAIRMCKITPSERRRNTFLIIYFYSFMVLHNYVSCPISTDRLSHSKYIYTIHKFLCTPAAQACIDTRVSALVLLY